MKDAFHPGELEVQYKVGEQDIADRNSVLISSSIVKGAINFVEKQPMAIVSSRNQANELWASLLIGNFGFVKVPDPATIVFDTRQLTSNPDDVFFSNIAEDPQIGSLFIELDSRKRLRVNGPATYENSRITLHVHQSYPNCPKYIQRRVISAPEYFEKTISIMTEGTVLNDEHLRWISSADTLFVATAGADGNLDASHRGGNPHFVEVLEDGVLKIPDYPGNSLFSTLGNIVKNPAVGLLFIDFEHRKTLQLTGAASLRFDQTAEKDLQKTMGTGRYWLFKPFRWIQTADHHRVNWAFLEYSRFNP